VDFASLHVWYEGPVSEAYRLRDELRLLDEHTRVEGPRLEVAAKHHDDFIEVCIIGKHAKYTHDPLSRKGVTRDVRMVASEDRYVISIDQHAYIISHLPAWPAPSPQREKPKHR
jgi:hypothetical protein